MATHYVRDCGHTELKDPWKRGENTPLKGQCDACKKSRMGQEISFIRFGAVPKSGRSRNHRDGYAEIGISVYELVDGQPLMTGWHFAITTRQEKYTGVGTIVGWGSDGEPLVKIKKIRRSK